MNKTSLSGTAPRHSEAMRGLNFYREEIKILELRLFEIASKNNSFEARQGIEHFQNQFMIQQNNIRDLKHSFNDHIHLMSNEVQSHDGQISPEQMEEDKKLMGEYRILEKVINGLRHEFNAFLSKWM